MKNNNINIQIPSINLLNNAHFLTFLEIEAEYNSVIKGGSISSFISQEERKRLVTEINFLNRREKRNLIFQGFIGSN